MTISLFQDAKSPDPTHNSREQHTKTHLKQDIEEFLAATSRTAPRNTICPKCGRVLQTVNATFSLYGSDKQWSIPLPRGQKTGVEDRKRFRRSHRKLTDLNLRWRMLARGSSRPLMYFSLIGTISSSTIESRRFTWAMVDVCWLPHGWV